MHDPVSSETQSNHDAKKLKPHETTDSTSSKGGEEENHSNTAEEPKGEGDSDIKMGDQTQQSMNGGNDVVMEDVDGSGEQSSDGRKPEEKQSTGAPAAASGDNGEGKDEKKEEAGDSRDDKASKEDKSASSSKGENGQKAPSGDTKPVEAKAPAAASPPPPVLRGTLSYNIELRRHLIRGMWNYENSSTFPPQRFELLRNLEPDEDAAALPMDGEFHGSFSLAYFHTTSKGKQKERSKVISESGVKIKFTKVEGEEEGLFKVDGTGTNQFGIFHINGTATPSPHDDGQYNIILRKRYEPSAKAPASTVDADAGKKSKKRKIGVSDDPGNVVDDGPLPPPSQSYDKNVVCLRGELYRDESDELGLGSGDVVHRIKGWWSSGLDLILADPQNVRGLCNRFEYEHKSTVPKNNFPISGRYSGWFDLNMEDGSKKKIMEKDVTLRFRKNNAGYHNVEGRGSNAFGKYSITGTLTMDKVITIFRHFQAKKTKVSRPITSAPPPINAPGQSRRPSLPAAPDPQLKLDEVKVPKGEEPFDPLNAPEHPTYSAVSRGVLRLNDDGSHSCQGKWAVTREHFNNGQTSNFTFRLESHFAADALKNSKNRPYPLDSEMYKGSFQLKKGGSRYQTVIDQQVVMKFRKNTSGSYNVYGKGVNAIGVFNLSGTLIMSGKTGGQVELYRMYPPELLAAPAAKAPASSASKPSDMLPGSENPPVASSIVPTSSSTMGPQRGGTSRRESTRLVKVPSRLEDDDPTAQMSRIMDKCNVILHFIREKDVERGAFFSEPVDPLALGIPTYHQVITEPMDLRTLHRKMEAGEVTTPEEFARLARLVFENAMTFNIDPTHSVHQAARNLLILFNQKYRDIDRMVTNLRRIHKEIDGGSRKDDTKRKRGGDDIMRTLKRRRLQEAQEMASANASSLQALVSAAPASAAAGVTRKEFSLMLEMIQQLQQQVVQTYTAVAEMSDDVESGPSTSVSKFASSAALPVAEYIPPPMPEKKKPGRRKPERQVEKEPVIQEDNRPLTLEEQELLTDTINKLPEDQITGVIQIIREAAKLSGEEDEIDLEIDQLDTATQRKLLRHVSKFIKQPKRQKGKGAKKSRAAPAPKKAAKVEPPAKIAKAEPAKKDPDSFFAFGSRESSDSDSEGEIAAPPPVSAPAAAEATKAGNTAKDFNLGDGFGGGDDDSDNEDIANGAAASWNISKPATESKSKEGDDDDEWGAAREVAIASKAREEDKKKREEKMKADAEQAKNQRLADAVAHGEEIKAQRQAEEEKEARLREQQEQEAEEQRLAAREAARAQVQSVEQTVDLDAQRDMMKQFEQNFIEKEMGGASPSSDFGF